MKKMLLKVYYATLKIKDAITIPYNRIITFILPPPVVKTTDETLDKIVSNKYSVSRYGDGEFALMYGESLMFQSHSEELRLRLNEIVKSKQQRHMVCIPNVFESVNWCTEKSENYWTKYLNLNRSRIYKMIDMKKEYYDTQVTRLYIDLKDKSKAEERFKKFRKIWNKRDVVIVEGAQSRLGVGNDLFNDVSSIERIICPPIDAFSKYNEILNAVKKQDKSKLILIALGPTATVLAYDLSILGYQAIDIGHIDIEYEWFLQKATEKQPVKNKYIGEVDNGTCVEEIIDEKYESEIVSKIV
ncbi:SP_1767 family glycosyltransferase [Peribacillus sp. JNUCC 23]